MGTVAAAAASIEAKNDSSSLYCAPMPMPWWLGRCSSLLEWMRKMKRNIHKIIVMYGRDYTQLRAGLLHNTIFPFIQ